MSICFRSLLAMRSSSAGGHVRLWVPFTTFAAHMCLPGAGVMALLFLAKASRKLSVRLVSNVGVRRAGYARHDRVSRTLLGLTTLSDNFFIHSRDFLAGFCLHVRCM